MKKTVFVLTAFVCMILISFAFTNADQPRYKNLKVLPKNTTKEQMDSIMKHFAQSLGVRCSFCHAFNQEQKAMDFASDEKKTKSIARDMIRMTNKINKKYFKEDYNRAKERNTLEAMTCYSCHHGQEHPGRRPPQNMEQRGPRMERNPADSTKHSE